MTTPSGARTIRWVETNVLDTQYKKYKITLRPQDEAIPHLLKVTGDIWRELTNSPLQNNRVSKTTFDNILGGLGHCIRWTINSPSRQVHLPRASYQELDREAVDFLRWGIHYHMLYLDHVAWSRGWLEATIDEGSHTIEFSYGSNFDKRFLATQLFDLEKTSLSQRVRLSDKALEADFPQWMKLFRFNGQGFNVTKDVTKLETAYRAVERWLDKIAFPEINDEEVFGGYSLREFKKFFAALFLHCEYLTWLEDRVDNLLEDENALGSLLLALDKDSMIEWLVEISGVDRGAMKAIIDDLTFVASSVHASLVNQPFVKSSQGNLYLLPRLFARIDPLRLLSGALNKSELGRKTYGRIVESVSSKVLEQIRSSFDTERFDVWKERTFLDKSGKQHTPDLIVFDKDNRELLIAEYKHSIVPFGPSEVDYRVRELKKGLEQVQGYIEGLSKSSSSWISSLPVRRVFALLIYRFPMPMPIPSDLSIGIASWSALSRKMLPRFSGSLSELYNWVRTRPDLNGQLRPLRIEYFDIQVSDWKYRHPILVAD